MGQYCLSLLRQFKGKKCLPILKQRRSYSYQERISSEIFRLCELLDILSDEYDFRLFIQNGLYRLQIQQHKLYLLFKNLNLYKIFNGIYYKLFTVLESNINASSFRIELPCEEFFFLTIIIDTNRWIFTNSDNLIIIKITPGCLSISTISLILPTLVLRIIDCSKSLLTSNLIKVPLLSCTIQASSVRWILMIFAFSYL